MSLTRFEKVRAIVEKDSPYRVDKKELRRLLCEVPRARRKHRREQIEELTKRCLAVLSPWSATHER